MKQLILSLLPVFAAASIIAQHYQYAGESPFGIQVTRPDGTGLAMGLHFADMDADGDPDLILYGLDSIDPVGPPTWSKVHYFLEYQENTGSALHPQFSSRRVLHEGFPFPAGYFFAAAEDLNDDRRIDFLVNGEVDPAGNRSVLHYRQNPENTQEQFAISRLDTLGLPPLIPASMFMPILADFDQDGDNDLLMSGANPPFGNSGITPEPVLYYAQNQGSPQSAAFVGWFENPFHLAADPLIEIITGAGDMDLDGDLDLVGTRGLIPPDSMNYVIVHYNFSEGDGTPYFGTGLKSPYGLPKGRGTEQYLFPKLTDIDGDNDLDLFIFRVQDSTWHLEFFEYWHCRGGFADVQATICEGESYSIGPYSLTFPGFYNLHLETPQGCDSTVALLLNVTDAPSRNLSATICFGETFTIGGENFTASGFYTVFMASPDGCDSLILLSLTVTDEILAEISEEDDALLALPPGMDYQWFDCNTGLPVPGATGQSFSPSSSGTYAVRLTDTLGCSTTSACVPFTVTALGGAGKPETLRLFPNPTSGLLHVLPPEGISAVRINVATSSGQLVRAVSAGDLNTVDLSDMAPGMYFLRIFTTKGEVIRRVVVD